MEVPEAETLDIEMSTVEQPAMEEPTNSPLPVPTAHREESGSSTTTQSHPSESVGPRTLEDLAALFRREYPRTEILEPLDEVPSAARDRIIDLELDQSLEDERRAVKLVPPTRAEIERSLLRSADTPTDLLYTTNIDRDEKMADVETPRVLLDMALLTLRFIKETDERCFSFIDFEGCPDGA